MNLFMQFLLQSVTIIVGIMVVFQLIGKLFMKDDGIEE